MANASILNRKRIAVIGGGNMGSALVAGMLAAGTIDPRRITVTDVRPDTLMALKKRYSVRVSADNRGAVKTADIVLLCSKPQQIGPILDDLRGCFSKRTLVISIAAGLRTRFIEDRISARSPVIRVMPNTPALLRAGALAYCAGRNAKAVHRKIAVAILSSVGKVWKAREDQMDAVTALSGSGPAYFFFLAECLTEAGKALGLPESLAADLARQTAYGAGRMLLETPDSADVLRQRVTSPGGTTAAAMKVLENEKVRKAFQKALSAASRRSRELSGG